MADLPALKAGEFYYFRLAGAEVMLTDGRRLGMIEEVIATGANDVWVVRDGEREVLVPVIATSSNRWTLRRAGCTSKRCPACSIRRSARIANDGIPRNHAFPRNVRRADWPG